MKNRKFLCTKTVIIDGEYIYEGQEYCVDKKGCLIIDDDIVLFPNKNELKKHGIFK